MGVRRPSRGVVSVGGGGEGGGVVRALRGGGEGRGRAGVRFGSGFFFSGGAGYRGWMDQWLNVWLVVLNTG